MQHRLPQHWHALAQQKTRDQRAQRYSRTRELEGGREAGSHRVSDSVEAGSHLLGTSIKGSAALRRFRNRRNGSSIHPTFQNTTGVLFHLFVCLKDAPKPHSTTGALNTTCVLYQTLCFYFNAEDTLSKKWGRGSVNISGIVKRANAYIAQIRPLFSVAGHIDTPNKQDHGLHSEHRLQAPHPTGEHSGLWGVSVHWPMPDRHWREFAHCVAIQDPLLQSIGWDRDAPRSQKRNMDCGMDSGVHPNGVLQYVWWYWHVSNQRTNREPDTTLLLEGLTQGWSWLREMQRIWLNSRFIVFMCVCSHLRR